MDYFPLHQIIIWALIVLYITYEIFKKYKAPIAALFLYCAGSALVIFQSKIMFYEKYTIRLHTSSAESFAKMVCFAFLALTFDRWRNHWKTVVNVISISNALLVCFRTYGFFNATSFDATIIVCSIPVFFSNQLRSLNAGLVYLAIVVTALFRTGESATAYFVIIGMLGALAVKYKQWKYLIGSLAIFSIAFITNGMHLFSSSNRVKYWEEVFTWWERWVNPWWGAGIGTFEFLGPWSQMSLTKRTTDLVIWMHNDYLQMFYEGGIIGLAVALLAWIYIGVKSFKQTWTFVLYAAFSVSMLSYHPIHWGFSQFMMLCLVCEVLWKDEK